METPLVTNGSTGDEVAVPTAHPAHLPRTQTLCRTTCGREFDPVRWACPGCGPRHLLGTLQRAMLLWMSSPGEALLSGLSGGAQHAGYGGPGGAVLPGADHGGLQLFVGVDEVQAGIGEHGDGVGFSGRQAAARLAFA